MKPQINKASQLENHNRLLISEIPLQRKSLEGEGGCGSTHCGYPTAKSLAHTSHSLAAKETGVSGFPLWYLATNQQSGLLQL